MGDVVEFGGRKAPAGAGGTAFPPGVVGDLTFAEAAELCVQAEGRGEAFLLGLIGLPVACTFGGPTDRTLRWVDGEGTLSAPVEVTLDMALGPFWWFAPGGKRLMVGLGELVRVVMPDSRKLPT